VHEDKVIVLADDAAASSQIDVERARQARALIEQRMNELRERPTERPEEITSCIADLEWCEVQIRVDERRR
jgi:F0F1-type ATP synthase epsilon subunit